MEKMTVNLYGDDFEIVGVACAKYNYGDNLAIQLYSKDKEYGIIEPFATLTTNLHPLYGDNLAYIDTNNCSWAVEFIKKYKLGKPTGKTMQSGFCTYPLYEMDVKELKKYAGVCA